MNIPTHQSLQRNYLIHLRHPRCKNKNPAWQANGLPSFKYCQTSVNRGFPAGIANCLQTFCRCY